MSTQREYFSFFKRLSSQECICRPQMASSVLLLLAKNLRTIEKELEIDLTPDKKHAITKARYSISQWYRLQRTFVLQHGLEPLMKDWPSLHGHGHLKFYLLHHPMTFVDESIVKSSCFPAQTASLTSSPVVGGMFQRLKFSYKAYRVL